MNISDYIVSLIHQRYKSIRQFALAINVPYSTIKSGLRSGVDGMAVETVIKICNALGIRVEDLYKPEFLQDKLILSKEERGLLLKYRQLPSFVKSDVQDYIEMKYLKNIQKERKGLKN